MTCFLHHPLPTGRSWAQQRLGWTSPHYRDQRAEGFSGFCVCGKVRAGAATRKTWSAMGGPWGSQSIHLLIPALYPPEHQRCAHRAPEIPIIPFSCMGYLLLQDPTSSSHAPQSNFLAPFVNGTSLSIGLDEENEGIRSGHLSLCVSI